MFYIYILKSELSDKYYVGYSEDVIKRLHQHNNPVKNVYTAKYIPWSLQLYFEVSTSRSDAMKVEKFIKKQKSRRFIKSLIEQRDNPFFFKKLVNDVCSFLSELLNPLNQFSPDKFKSLSLVIFNIGS
jgi:putative endonuclease